MPCWPKAVEAEVTDFLGKHADLKTEAATSGVVRHGHLPEREVMTGIGPVAVRQPRVRDREAVADDPDPLSGSRRRSCPPYMRRSKSIETLLQERRRGRGFSFARRQHVRHRYARC